MDNRFADALEEYLRDAPPDRTLASWYKLPEVHLAYIRMADAALSDFEEPDHHGTGRGIVTAGGGVKYFPSLMVLLASLTQAKCKLPVEVWYYGDAELDPVMQAMLLGAYHTVSLRDASGAGQRMQRSPRAGTTDGPAWPLKVHAVMRSEFQEALFLDADNSVIRDPECCFRAREYVQGGALFWPDFVHWIRHPNRHGDMVEWVYPAFGVEPPENTTPPVYSEPGLTLSTDEPWYGKPRSELGEGYDLTFESGQFLVDRKRCWRELALADWYCQHSDYYFQFVQGDNEAMHFAWRRLGTPYGLAPYLPDYDQHTMLHRGFDRMPLFEHRNLGSAKWQPWMEGPVKGLGARRGLTKNEPLGLRVMAELRKGWSGRMWWNPEPSPDEGALGKSLTGREWHYYRQGLDSRLLDLLPGGRVGKGRAAREAYWSVWGAGSDAVLAIGGEDGGVTCLLKPHEDAWRGRWALAEKVEVTLFTRDL